MITRVDHYVSKGVQNNSGSPKFTWYKTNFNMPVPNISIGGTYNRYTANLTYLNQSLSYDLSGFIPGLEICNGIAVFDFYNDGGTDYNINCTTAVAWRDSTATVVLVGPYTASVVVTLPPGYWTSTWMGANIGCAPWEVSASANYLFRSNASGTPAIGTTTSTVAMTNVPSMATNGTPGYIWVEGNNLCYITGGDNVHTTDYRKQTMVGVDGGSAVGTAGYIWIDTTTNKLCWIGNNGHKYTAKWCVQQFASFYGNGATGATFAGTSKAGFIWVDREFGQTHLAYIGSNGYKFLTGGGDDPYA